MGYVLFTATHSIISTYFGSMTIVLNWPFTSVASTKGLARYKGRETGEGETGFGACGSAGGNVADVGVGDLLGPLGALRVMERLQGVRSQEIE